MMEITVKMTSEDFMEFMEWRKDKTASEKALREAGEEWEKLAEMVLRTLEECGETEEPEYKIRSQEEAVKLITAATDGF